MDSGAVTFSENGGALIAILNSEIDHHLAKGQREAIDAMLFRKKPSVLVLDFSSVRFMDSSGIGLVMGRYKLMKTVQGRIRVENLSPGAYKVMVLAGLEKLGEIKQKEVV